MQALLDWTLLSRWRLVAVYALLAAITLIPGQATISVTDRDEGRYIQASKQMMETGDYIEIWNIENPRWKKPAGIHWLQVAAAQITGYGAEAPIWVYRLPSAFGMFFAGLLTFWALYPLLGKRAAALAGMMMLTCLIAAGEGNIAKTDAVLLAACTATAGALARLYEREARGPGLQREHWILWLAVSAGVLVKGPIIFLLLGGILLSHTILERDLQFVRQTKPLFGLAVLAVVALPWFIAIGFRTDWQYYFAAVGDDLLGKVTEGQQNHWGPPGYYIATVWLMLWPWAALLVLSLGRAWRERGSDAMRFLASWIIPFWAVFAVTSTKLPHYTLPVFPALVGLMAYGLIHGLNPSRGWRIVAAALFLLGTAVWAGISLVVPPLELGGILPTAVALAGFGSLAALAAVWSLLKRQDWQFAGYALAAGLLIHGGLFGVTLPAAQYFFPSRAIAEAHLAYDACAPRPFRSIDYREPSVWHYTATTARFLTDNEAAELLSSGESGWRVWLNAARRTTPEELEALVGAPLQELARVEAFNPNQGREIDMRLLARADDTSFADCLP
ncbi:MAG: glycosyltransferase family 39 protein [Pseudomonadota bacterium]